MNHNDKKFEMKNYKSTCSKCDKYDYVCCADLCENDLSMPGRGVVYNPVCPDCCTCCDTEIARSNIAAMQQ